MQTILHLLRGIGAVVEFSKDSIRTGPVASLLREVSPDSDKPAAPDVEGALERLDALLAAREQVQRDAGMRDGSCVQAIGNLRVAFRNVRTARGRLSSIFKWAVTIDDEFLVALRREDEGALVVLALYGVLFDGLDGFWWTRGWGRALIVAVEGKVKTDEARELLSWAWRKVQRDSP